MMAEIGRFDFARVKVFQDRGGGLHSSMKSHSLFYSKQHIVFYSNSLAIWHGFPVFTHIIVNNIFKNIYLKPYCKL